MIFYFSGTGNSKHVAEKLLCDEKIADMSLALEKRRCGFNIRAGEAVGFVCPVYYSGVPKVVLDFIRHVKLKGDYSYLYLVLTHGGGPGAAGALVMHELKKRGYSLNAVFDIKMPSNYIMFKDLADVSEENRRLADAETAVCNIRLAVLERRQSIPHYSWISKLATFSMYPICDRYMSSKKFYADEKCVGCGICASRCPADCIRMEKGRPVWREKHCIRCMACLRCNAVQYGDKMKERRRYSYHAVD